MTSQYVQDPMRAVVVIAIMLTAIGCSNRAESTTTSAASETEPDQFISDLNTAGAEAEQVESFSSDPLGGKGLLVCVGGEEVRLYLFDGEQAAATAANRIDPDDPSHVGTAIVEWAGNPRFWHRGPILVLYLGADQVTEDLLIEVLGTPFARGPGPGRGLAGVPGPCAD